jgi:hypothetical protein
MDSVRTLMEELKSNPHRFQKCDGYGRLLKLLRDGHSPLAVKELLQGNAEFVGDLLWTVCELDDLAPYAEEAVGHIDDPDRGTAAYAIEVVLRAAHDGDSLGAVLRRLEAAPIPVREHAVLVLASEGLVRARDVFRLGNWAWADVLLDGLLDGSRDAEATLRALLGDSREDRLLVGLMVAALASEHDDRAVRILEQSEREWVPDFAMQLRQMFQHRWKSSK